ncbi:large ribosomal subunit protein uL23m isoform X2 [Hyperolius riggenbachi]|uniref:large ribosomal subunit protein uL23m isoform X2 n=1 Tax=Hyperolius riggenbachi TaxID=752182 RepID=UPI0035A33E9D
MASKVLYPLYQLGNPQLRVFRTNFFMTLVRPGKPQPPDTVQFRIHLEMTKCDVRNYLEKIYNVPVATVRTRIQYGSYSRRNHLNQRVKNPDYKVAYVQLPQEKSQEKTEGRTVTVETSKEKNPIFLWRKMEQVLPSKVNLRTMPTSVQ